MAIFSMSVSAVVDFIDCCSRERAEATEYSGKVRTDRRATYAYVPHACGSERSQLLMISGTYNKGSVRQSR